MPNSETASIREHHSINLVTNNKDDSCSANIYKDPCINLTSLTFEMNKSSHDTKLLNKALY